MGRKKLSSCEYKIKNMGEVQFNTFIYETFYLRMHLNGNTQNLRNCRFWQKKNAFLYNKLLDVRKMKMSQINQINNSQHVGMLYIMILVFLIFCTYINYIIYIFFGTNTHA